MTPDRVAQLAQFLPGDWGYEGPSIVRPAPSSSPVTDGARAFNPGDGAPPVVETPLRVLVAAPVSTDLVLRLRYERPDATDATDVIVWVVNLSQTAEDVPLREVSSGIWGILLRRLSGDLLSQTVVTSSGVRLLID